MQEKQGLEQLLNVSCDNTYFNGFSLAVGISDVLIGLQQNGKQHLVLNTSYTVAKTLAIALTESIELLESKTGNKIMTVQQIEQSLKDSSSHDK